MERNHKTLQDAIGRFPKYEPADQVWEALHEKLNEGPLQKALRQMPVYEPDDKLWALIEKKNNGSKTAMVWWYAAAAAIVLMAGVLLVRTNPSAGISYTQEKADPRLQTGTDLVTDVQYQKLKAYCETETLVCNSDDYRRLRTEYEKLSSASDQLQQAIGNYNAEPELVRQFISVEQQKAEILNEMAKMI
jgi:uncharacterized membrane-anchored protein YhcB (DUF1043 family)